jgi:hypothetical protein
MTDTDSINYDTGYKRFTVGSGSWSYNTLFDANIMVRAVLN